MNALFNRRKLVHLCQNIKKHNLLHNLSIGVFHKKESLLQAYTTLIGFSGI